MCVWLPARMHFWKRPFLFCLRGQCISVLPQKSYRIHQWVYLVLGFSLSRLLNSLCLSVICLVFMYYWFCFSRSNVSRSLSIFSQHFPVNGRYIFKLFSSDPLVQWYPLELFPLSLPILLTQVFSHLLITLAEGLPEFWRITSLSPSSFPLSF